MLKEILKSIFRTISNPLLYYVNSEGESVFRNYCLFKNTGNMYKINIPKKNAGKTLEFRFELDKILKRIYILTPIILYLIFIHVKFSIWNILLFELLWILIVNSSRIVCSCIFSRHLIRNFGKYEVVAFKPPLSKKKYKEFQSLFLSKSLALVIIICLLFIPSFILNLLIKNDIGKKHNFSQAITLSKVYLTLYPKNEQIYDMRAYAKYRQKDFESAIEDYKVVLDMSGKKFNKKDLTRLANLLYLKRIVSTPNEAIDLFNEYSTKKITSILQTSQLLWIKSMFKIENQVTDGITSDYDDLISSLDEKDLDNTFYISSDKAYVLYLMQEYGKAVDIYNLIISYAQSNKDNYTQELKSLYAERGFAKYQLGDIKGAEIDFQTSGIEPSELQKFEPSYSKQEFIKDFK